MPRFPTYGQFGQSAVYQVSQQEQQAADARHEAKKAKDQAFLQSSVGGIPILGGGIAAITAHESATPQQPGAGGGAPGGVGNLIRSLSPSPSGGQVTSGLNSPPPLQSFAAAGGGGQPAIGEAARRQVMLGAIQRNTAQPAAQPPPQQGAGAQGGVSLGLILSLLGL